jgi:hypothetical protein
LKNKLWGLLAIIIVLGFGTAMAWLACIKKYTKQIIWASLIFGCAFMLILAGISAAVGQYIGAIIFGVLFLFQLLYVFLVSQKQ